MSQDQTLFVLKATEQDHPIVGGYSMSGTMFTLNQTEVHAVAYALEHHPNDSRLKISEDGICQTLNSRMGTGGGNVPLVMINESIQEEKPSDA